MARATAYLHVINERRYLENAQLQGNYLRQKLEYLSQQYPELITNPRGRGLFCAFDLPSPEYRQQFLRQCYVEGLLILGSGEQSVRFRPTLDVKRERIDEAIAIIEKVLQATAA